MSTEFKWDDESVMEFYDFHREREGQWTSESIQQFKKSKQPKPEWEILTYRQIGGFGGIQSAASYRLESPMDKNDFKIHSVKRITDGEVFTIGDKVIYKYEKEHIMTISSMYISGTVLYMYDGIDRHWLITSIKKSPKILFTSQDGKPIYKDDKFYFVDKSFRINEYWADSCWTPVQDGLEFSTKDAAEDYVLHNKPTISLSQVLLRYSLIFGNNDEFAESMKNIAFKAIHNDTK